MGDAEAQAMNQRVRIAFTRAALGLPLTPTQQRIIAYHPMGTAAGCASCGR